MAVLRTISCRVSEDLYQALQELATEKGITMTEAIVAGLKKVCEGKIPLNPTDLEAKIPFCPDCGFILLSEHSGGRLHLVCFRCGFFTYVHEPEYREGEFYLPETKK